MHLHVEQRGEGPAVVLAHGFAGSARNFRPQVRALSDRHSVVVYDAPGHARSAAAARSGSTDLAHLVDAFAEVADAASAEPVVAGGLSLGAATALSWALSRPERVRGLILASFPAGRGAAGGVSAGALEFAEAIDREGLEAAGARYVWGPDSGFDSATGALVRQGFLEHPAEALSGLLRGALTELRPPEAMADALATCRIPALVIAGSEDRSSLAACRSLAELLPDARLEVIEGAGHVVNLAAPARFNELAIDFLASLGC